LNKETPPRGVGNITRHSDAPNQAKPIREFGARGECDKRSKDPESTRNNWVMANPRHGGVFKAMKLHNYQFRFRAETRGHGGRAGSVRQAAAACAGMGMRKVQAEVVSAIRFRLPIRGLFLDGQEVGSGVLLTRDQLAAAGGGGGRPARGPQITGGQERGSGPVVAFQLLQPELACRQRSTTARCRPGSGFH